MRLRRVRRVLRRVGAAVRRVSPVRGQALLTGAQAAYTVVTGQPTASVRRRQQAKAARDAKLRAQQRRKEAAAKAAGAAATGKAAGAAAQALTDAVRDELERGERALQAGQTAEALRRSASLARQLPTNLRVLQLRASALAGQDDAYEHTVALHRLHTLRDDADVRGRERVAAGRLIVTSPDWLPRIPGGPSPLQPAGGGVVLVLASSSGPLAAPALARRLRARLADLAAAGLRAEVMTSLGFPRSAGATELAATEVDGDGVPHHRLDLGPSYDLDGAADRRLRDAAWLAAGVLSRVRPGMLFALADGDAVDTPLVAAALSRRFAVPLVVDVAGDDGASVSADARRSQAALARVLLLADHVVAGDEATRDRLIDRGHEASRVTLVPSDGDGATRVAALRSVAERIGQASTEAVGAAGGGGAGGRHA